MFPMIFVFLKMMNDMKTRRSFRQFKYSFISAFYNGGYHFELFIGIKTMRCMRWYDYPLTQIQFVFFFINDHFSAPVNDLNIIIKGRSFFSEFLSQGK